MAIIERLQKTAPLDLAQLENDVVASLAARKASAKRRCINRITRGRPLSHLACMLFKPTEIRRMRRILFPQASEACSTLHKKRSRSGLACAGTVPSCAHPRAIHLSPKTSSRDTPACIEIAMFRDGCPNQDGTRRLRIGTLWPSVAAPNRWSIARDGAVRPHLLVLRLPRNQPRLCRLGPFGIDGMPNLGLSELDSGDVLAYIDAMTYAANAEKASPAAHHHHGHRH